MELQFVGKPIHCLERVVWDVQELEQTQEIRLPEDMPDIGCIVCAWGQCVLRGKEWNSDRISVSGGVMAWVIYIPADGSEPRTVEAWLPMSGKCTMPETKQEGSIRTNWLLSAVDGRMLSARKMLVRASAQVLTEAMVPSQTEIYVPDQLPEDVQLLKKTYMMQLPKESGEKTFSMEEELTIPDMETPVSYTLTPVVREQLVVGGKAVFRGDARLHLVYIGLDGMLHSADRELTFSQFSDLDRDYDKEATLCVMPAVSNLELEAISGGVQMKVTLVMQYLVHDREEIEVCEDAYSYKRPVKCQNQMLQLPMELDRMQKRFEIDLAFPDCQWVDVSVFPRHCAVHRAGQLHELENCGSMQVVYYDESGHLNARTEHYSSIWELPGDCTVLGVLKDVEQPQMGMLGNVQSALQMEAVAVSDGAMEAMSGVELGDVVSLDPARPSLILRRAGDCSLWCMAKECGSTMDAIVKANGLDGEPDADRMLLIPVI